MGRGQWWWKLLLSRVEMIQGNERVTTLGLAITTLGLAKHSQESSGGSGPSAGVLFGMVKPSDPLKGYDG